MKINLTKKQVSYLINMCILDYNDDYPKSDPNNRFIERLQDKLQKAYYEDSKRERVQNA